MATAAVEDVIKVNIVLVGYRLLSTQEEVDTFRDDIKSDVQIAGAGFTANIQSGNTEPLYNLVLNKDRIALELSSLRSTISRDYPEEKDLVRLALVASQAIRVSDLTDQSPRAFGFNIELVFNPYADLPAFDYLGARLFREDLGNEGWTLSGGSGKLIFADNSSIPGNLIHWTIALEPRFNDARASRVFLSLNLHHSEERVPTQAEIEDSLKLLWDQAYKFVERLGPGE